MFYTKRLPRAAHKLERYFMSSNYWYFMFIKRSEEQRKFDPIPEDDSHEPPKYIDDLNKLHNVRSPHPLVLCSQPDSHTNKLTLFQFLNQ